MSLNRREFLKRSTATCAALTAMRMGGGGLFRPASAAASGLPGSLGAAEVTSVCEMCFWRCPIVGKVKDGKLVKIEGNPKSPVNGTRVCARGNSGVQLVYDPDRVKYPMKRKGARGEGKWVRITWDEALDEIAHNIQKVKKQYGPHALAYFDHGASAENMRGIFKALGTENYTGEPAFFQCVGPAALAYLNTVGYITTGTRQYNDMGHAKAILLIGSHLGENIHVSHIREYIQGLSNGAKLVVVDPRFSAAANKADIYLPIRPGTDTALLLAWINHVISHNLYDKDFVANHCQGFDDLKAATKNYSMDWAARVCDLKVPDMVAAIELLAKASPNVNIHPGRHSTWYGKGDVGRHQSQAILTALFGAVGVPGGIYFPTKVKKGKAECAEAEAEEIQPPKVSLKEGKYPFSAPFGTVTADTIKAIITGKPYPVKLLGVNGVNIIQTIPNPYETMKAINNLDFIFCEDIMAGETAAWSDIVLPGAVYLERYDAVYSYDGLTPYLTVRQPVVPALYEAKSPYWIAKNLAKRLNIKGYTCDKEEDFIEEELKAAGLSLAKLHAEGGIVTYPGKPYRDRNELEIGTDSGKVNLAVEEFASKGLDAVPKFIPAPAPPKGYTRLIYGRSPVHTFSRTMNNEWLHHEEPENRLWLNDEVAKHLGIKDDEVVTLENQDGKRSLPIKVLVTPGIRPDAVYMTHGFGSRSPLLSRAYKKGAADGFMMTNTIEDPYMGATSKRTNFVRIVKDKKVLAIPELRPVPREIPYFKSKRA
ncbi:MAG: molybdopterin-dependent oxidoreductase [Desulfobacteraceae bacterium]|nr:molybdopterin-dependent oxidoreductase [Desulfobacteraceae bacterium]